MVASTFIRIDNNRFIVEFVTEFAWFHIFDSWSEFSILENLTPMGPRKICEREVPGNFYLARHSYVKLRGCISNVDFPNSTLEMPQTFQPLPGAPDACALQTRGATTGVNNQGDQRGNSILAEYWGA